MQPLRFASAVFACLVVTAPAFSEELGVRSYGLRGGVSANPDQFVVGAHLDAGRLSERIRLQPSFELGFGNGVLLGAANFDVHYMFSRRSSFRPYAGGGPGLNVFDVSEGTGEGSGLNIEPVLNLVGGVEWGAARQGSRATGRYLLEVRVGMGDTPEFKLAFGVSF